MQPRPSFTFEITRDPVPLFPEALIVVFRRPSGGLPKGLVRTLVGIPTRHAALFVMTISGRLQPDIETLVLLK